MANKPQILTIHELNGEYRIKRVDGYRVFFSDRWYESADVARLELQELAPCYQGYRVVTA